MVWQKWLERHRLAGNSAPSNDQECLAKIKRADHRIRREDRREGPKWSPGALNTTTEEINFSREEIKIVDAKGQKKLFARGLANLPRGIIGGLAEVNPIRGGFSSGQWAKILTSSQLGVEGVQRKTVQKKLGISY